MTERQRRRANRAEAIVTVTLLLLPLLFWWRLWAPDPADRAVIPEGDFTAQYYPLQRFAARELAAGRLPAWNPYLNAGQPGLADIQTGFFYPFNLVPNLLLAALGLPYTVGMLTAQAVVHFSLASLFTYLFVRRLALRAGSRQPAARFAGAVAALSFTYGGYLTSFPVQQITILETAVWLPLVLFFMDRAFEAPHPPRPHEDSQPGTGPRAQIVLASLALAAAFLAGHPQTALYVVYASLAYALFASQPLPAGPSYVSRFVRYAFPVVALAALLAAVQLWPTLAFIARSTRADLDYDAVASGFSLHELTHLLYPGFFGGSPQYVGILPPILAFAAFFTPRLRRPAVFWAAVAIVALLLAFGGNTFLYSVAYLLAPGFAAVRNQERIIFLFSFAVSVLAGYGALILVQPLPRLERKGFRHFAHGLGWALAVLLGFTALFYAGYVQGLQQGVPANVFEGVLRHHVLLLLILAGSVLLFALRRWGRVRRARIALALVLIALNLFTVNWRYNLADPPQDGAFPATGLVEFLRHPGPETQPGAGPFRISSGGLLPGGASAASVYELEDITANTPLRLAAFQTFEEELGNWRQWQLLNVHYVLARRDLAGPGLTQVYEEGPVKVYEVGDPLPRAWVVHHTIAADGPDVPGILNRGDLDPRATAVVSGDDSLPAMAEAADPGPAATVTDTRPGHLALAVAPDRDGLLVISQPFYAGWAAWVDGERVPIHRVDLMLQGIPLTAGTHRVELRYWPSPVPAIISLLALGACLAALASSRRR